MARLRSIEESRVLPDKSPNLSDDETEWRQVSRGLKAERRIRLKALAVDRFDEDGTRGVGKVWAEAWREMEDADAPVHVARTPDDNAGFGPDSAAAHVRRVSRRSSMCLSVLGETLQP